MDTELLVARVKDTAEICERTSRPKFFGFLSEEQAVLAAKNLAGAGCDFSFFGGYDGAKRVMLGCFPEWDCTRNFPIGAVTFLYRKADEIRHRDFLGSLMALGLTRESVGDILIESGRAVAFVTEEIKDYVIAQTDKIGRVGVVCKPGFSLPLPVSDTLAEFSDTVSSARLDCVVSALGGFSRSAAAEKIAGGLVTVNSELCEKTTKIISSGDILSIRGKGKFIIVSLDERTKKNRIVIKYKKYV